MQHQLIRHGQGSRTRSIRLDGGEEVNACLEAFAWRELLGATRFVASGSLQGAVLGDPDAERHDGRHNALVQPTQVASLAGDIVLRSGKPQRHMRAVLGKHDGTPFEGHFLKGHVRQRLEMIMAGAPVPLRKDYDTDAGLALSKRQGEAG